VYGHYLDPFLVRKVRRHGRVVDGTDKGARGRKSAAEENVAEKRLKAEIVAEALTKN
jgi:hypothetical protein